MKVRIETLRAAAKACFDYMEASYGPEVEVPDEHRWELPFEATVDMSKVPSDVQFEVQDLAWSYSQLTRVERDEGFTGGPVEMEHLGLLLREIGEKISSE